MLHTSTMAEIQQPPKKRKSLKVVLHNLENICSSATNHVQTNDPPNHPETLNGHIPPPKKRKLAKIVIQSLESQSLPNTNHPDTESVIKSINKPSKKTETRQKKLPAEANKEHNSNPVVGNKKKSSSTSQSNRTANKSAPKPLINSNICRFCGKFYTTAAELEEHETNHTVNKELLCPQCGMGFSRRSYLAEHACIHSGEKPHTCYYCDRAFTLRCNLVRHVRIHTGEKPFVCDICKKDFTLKKNMIEHKRTHTGEKPFDCKLCDQTFSRRSSLVRHLRIHTGEKLYECNECRKKFSWKYYLQRHMATHLKNKTRKRRRRSNNKQKEEPIDSKPVPPKTDIINCENDTRNDSIETTPEDKFIEHSYAMENSPMDESNFKIKEEFGRNEEIEFKEESFDYQENGPGESELPMPREPKQLSVVVSPIIVSAHSTEPEVSAQTNPIIPSSNDVISFKMTRNEFDSFCGRRLHVKLNRLEDIPFEMQEE